jgi:hypothetical protein
VASTKSLYSKVLYQLAPAALVSAVGIALLSSLAQPVAAPPQAAPVNLAVRTEAVFTPTPKVVAAPQAVEEPAVAAAHPVAKPKPQSKVATTETPLPRQPAVVADPLPITPPVAEQPVVLPAPEQKGVMARLRGIGSTVARVPQQTYSTVTGWFSRDEPPRPPAEVPQQDFIASM